MPKYLNILLILCIVLIWVEVWFAWQNPKYLIAFGASALTFYLIILWKQCKNVEKERKEKLRKIMDELK